MDVVEEAIAQVRQQLLEVEQRFRRSIQEKEFRDRGLPAPEGARPTPRAARPTPRAARPTPEGARPAPAAVTRCQSDAALRLLTKTSKLGNWHPHVHLRLPNKNLRADAASPL